MQEPALRRLDRLNERDLDQAADFCAKLHEDADRLCRSLAARLRAQQDGA
ncbi:Rop family plasmid primer RNA-binding protein [Klebsiella pneumoniae]